MDFRRTELWGFGALALFAATTALPEVAPRQIASASSWRVLPVFGGGYVQNVVVAPSNPSRWYTYVDVGGPYRSDDGGRSWKPIHAAMPPEMRDVWADHVRALSVDPRNAETFVIAAGDRFAKPAGVYITRDGGRTFRQTLTARFYGDGNRRWMGQCMARNPRNPNILFCGEDWDGIFRSDDGGETWRKMGLERTWITDIRIDPDYPDTLYVCAPKLPMSRQIRPGDPRERETGFFRSDDGGETWQRSPTEAIPSETVQIAGQPPIVLNDGNNWSGAAEVPADAQWTYDTPAGYISSESGSIAKTVTFSHPVRKIPVGEASIEWVDDNNAAGLRPESVRINLLADNVICYTPRTAKGTTVSWGDLLVPMYRKGSLTG